MVGRTIEEISIILDLSWIKKRNKKYEIVNTEEKLLKHLDKIRNAELLGFDTETDGLNIANIPWSSSKKNRLVGICLSYEDNQGIYIPVAHIGIMNMPMSVLNAHLFKLLETKPIATHNGIFDYKVMYDIGVKLNIVHDSMLLIFNICSNVAKAIKKLKIVTRKIFADETVEFEDIFGVTKDYGKFKLVSEEVARIYGCADSDYTRMIIYHSVGFLSDKQLRCYMEDCSLIPLIATAEYLGKPIDMELLPKHKSVCEQNIEKLQDLLYNYVGWKLSGDMHARYVFKETSSDELLHVFYNKLHYEKVESYNDSGRLKIDKFVLKKLSDRKVSVADEFIKERFKEDIEDPLNPDVPLLKVKDLMYTDCPPALIIKAINKQVKNLTSFFNKIYKETDIGSARYFSPISMTNTETARLVDFIQTLDGKLKYLIKVPDSTKQYMFVFDFCQIEYRVMAALACLSKVVNNLDNPHTDFHVELAAIILSIDPSQISDALRKKFKAINFSIPYGMAVRGLVSVMYGVGLSEEEQKEAEIEVGKMLEQWSNALPEIMDMLNNYRDMAIIPREYSHPTMTEFQNTSYVQGPDGRLRLFDLKDSSQQAIARIRRQAGNYPIQEFARTIYLRAIKNFFNRLIKEGLTDIKIENPDSPTGYSFSSKVTINMFVHDEAGGFCDNDVNVGFLYKLIMEECMLKLPGHPTYYCGINICDNWKDGKEGKFEAPIDFVKLMASDEKFVQRDNWVEYIGKEMSEYSNKASVKYIEELLGEELTVNKSINVPHLISIWKDYYYKKQLSKYGSKYRKEQYLPDKDTDNAVNYCIGTLLESGYTSLSITYEDRAEVVTKHIVHTNEFKKEIEYSEGLYSNLDTDMDIDFQIEDILNSSDGIQLQEEEVDVVYNVSLLNGLLI